MRAHLVVIGSGITGLCLALEAARRTDALSRPVVLLAGDEDEPTGLELCRHDLEGGLALEARHGVRFWSSFWQSTGRDPGWNACGALVDVGAEAPSGWARARELGAAVRREGEALVDEEAGTLCLEKARRCLEALAREAGAIVRLGERVTELRVEAGEVLGLRTTGGTIDCNTVAIVGESAINLTPGGPPPLTQKTWRERGFGDEAADERNARAPESKPSDLFGSDELGREFAASAFEERFEAEEPPRSEVRASVRGAVVASPDQHGQLWVGGVDCEGEQAALLAGEVLGEAASGEERTRPIWEPRDAAPIVGPVSTCQGVWLACGFGASASLFAPACAEGLATRILGGSGGWFDGPEFDPSRASLS